MEDPSLSLKKVPSPPLYLALGLLESLTQFPSSCRTKLRHQGANQGSREPLSQSVAPEPEGHLC